MPPGPAGYSPGHRIAGGNLATIGSLILILGLGFGQTSRFKHVKTYLFVLALMISFGAYAAGDRVWQRLAQAEVDMGVRWAMTRDTLSIHRDFPIFGSGFDTFTDIYTRYAQQSPQVLDHPHNDWVELLAVSGWAGLILVLAGLVFLFWKSFSRLNRIESLFSKGLLICGMGAVFSVSLHSITDFSLHRTAIALTFTAILGIMGWILGLEDGRPHKGIKEKFLHSHRGRKLTFLLILVVFTFLFLLCAINLAGRSLWMNRFIPSAINILNFERPDPSFRAALKAVTINPENGIGWFWVAQTLSNLETKPTFPGLTPVIPYRISDWDMKFDSLNDMILFFYQEALAASLLVALLERAWRTFQDGRQPFSLWALGL